MSKTTIDNGPCYVLIIVSSFGVSILKVHRSFCASLFICFYAVCLPPVMGLIKMYRCTGRYAALFKLLFCNELNNHSFGTTSKVNTKISLVWSFRGSKDHFHLTKRR